MKKNIKVFCSLLLALMLALTGCSLGSDGDEATEYLNDEYSKEDESDDNGAGSDDEIIFVEDLSEPEVGEGSGEGSADAQSQETADDGDSVKIVVFGDSQMATGRDDGTDFPSYLGQRIPNAVVYNLAIGGTTATLEATTNDASPENLTSTSFYGMAYCLSGRANRDATLAPYPGVLNTMNQIDPAEVDYYVIEYGANDFINGVPLDVDIYAEGIEKAHAFYNALSIGIDELKSISPNATFILMTPFYGIYVNSDGSFVGDSYVVSNGIGTLADYARKSVNVAEDNEIYSFDGMFKSVCDLYLDTAGEYLMDNLHLNVTGRQIFARLVAHIINFEEKNEPFAYLDTDFIRISEFNPDEYYRYDEGMMREYYPESWEKYIRGEFPLAQPSEEALQEYGSDITEG